MNEQPLVPPSGQPKRFFDIAPPKDFSPSSSSRPLIVSNKPEQADPMVTPPAVEEPPAAIPQVPQPTVPDHAEMPPAEAKIQEEYNEVEHELPAGPTEPQSRFEPTVAQNQGQPVDAADSSAVVVQHHAQHHFKRSLLLLVSVVIILAIIIDLFLDTGFWKTSLNIPHTHFFK